MDVQGKAVEHALNSIGFQSMSQVRIGKYVELNIIAENKDEAYEQTQDACKKLISNPIIEDFIINIENI